MNSAFPYGGQSGPRLKLVFAAGAVLLIALAVVALYRIALDRRDAGEEPKTSVTEIPPELEPLAEAPPLPPLHEIEPAAERKAAFIDYLAPVVRDVNDEIRARRAALLAVERRLDNGRELKPATRDWLERMVERYRVEATADSERIARLLERIDIIPVSLAVAQGALESAWGTSRFARQGNNIFGKWCFTEGCGIVPARRPANASYEVEAYDDVADSVRAYIHHLNSHPGYTVLRERRAEAREEERPLAGHELAAGLEFYSAKGEEYVGIIRGVIDRNELDRLARVD